MTGIMLSVVLGGSALITSLVALYYTDRALRNAEAALQVLIAAEIIDVKYVDEEEDE